MVRWPKIIFGQKVAIILVVSVMSMLVISVFWQASAAVVSPLKGRHVVMLDPGHGGYDPGAVRSMDFY